MPEEIEIRRLGAADAGLVSASEVFDHRPIPEQTDAFLGDDSHEIVGAIYGGRLIGFASGAVLLHPDKAPQFFISEVGVNAAFRRQGVATRLVNALIALAAELGCTKIWLAAESGNAPARGLYRKLAARETEGVVVYEWGDIRRK